MDKKSSAFCNGYKGGEANPSLIILDIHLPGLKRMEVLQLLKTDDVPNPGNDVFQQYILEYPMPVCHRLRAAIINTPE